MRNIRDVRLARAARRQHSVVCTADVRAARLDRHAVARRVRSERLHPMFPGTWCVGHRPLTREAWWTAGVLSAGEGALLDGASACQLYGVLEKRVGRVYVVRPGKAADRGRLKIRSARRMPPRRTRNGIPVVPIEEALLGLAASGAADRDVRRAMRQAMIERLTTPAKLLGHADRSRGRPGVARFRHLLGARPARTRSELEDAALDLLRRYGFDPGCNVVVAGEEADLLVDGVIVELDSEAFHDNSISAQDDARKQEAWEAAGYRVERLTFDDVHVTPVRTVRRLRRARR